MYIYENGKQRYAEELRTKGCCCMLCENRKSGSCTLGHRKNFRGHGVKWDGFPFYGQFCVEPCSICENFSYNRKYGIKFDGNSFSFKTNYTVGSCSTFWDAIDEIIECFEEEISTVEENKEFIDFITQIYGQDVMRQIKKDFKKYKEEQQK